MRRFPISRLLVLAGMFLPFVDLPLTYYFGTLHPDYSRMRQFMSELAESGRPHAELVRVWFAVSSLVLAGYCVGVSRLVPPSRASLAAKVLYLLLAGLSVASVFFPCDPGCAGETLSGWMHRLIGEITMVCTLPMPTLIWLVAHRNPRWRGFGWIALPAQALLVTASLAMAAAVFTRAEVGGVALREAAGLFQWFWWIVFYGWNFGLGCWLLRACQPDPIPI